MTTTATRRGALPNPVGLLLNLLWVYIVYTVCRVAFLLENWNLFSSGLDLATLKTLMLGGVRFDTSAIFYTNALFIVLYLFPLAMKERRWYHVMTRILYTAVNTVAAVLNLGDAVFFEFRKHRTSMAVFEEFKGENNLGSIAGVEVVNHWYLVLLAIALGLFLWYAYRKPGTPVKPAKRYYLTQIISLIAIAPVAVCCMRGNTFFSATRPIAVSYAHKYAKDPLQTGIVLNTPFSLIRTLNQLPAEAPQFFATEAELDAVYSPLHVPADSVTPNGKNIVILIVESFAQEFVGALNTHLDGGTYKGYTPFADSLLSVSTHWKQSFANAGFSIDAPPAVLASIPRMDRPFVLSPYSLNHLNSIATETGRMGYHSAFFHGADNESLGFNAFVKSIGFENYYGKNEFIADPRFGGASEFDGKWGIWDEPFLQFFATKLNEMPQPFVASVFTLSSHHPFKVPDKYKDRFPEEGKFEIHKCIRYADYSIGRFFETASRMPWYKNTIFVLTADHASSKRTHEEYFGEVGGFRVPIIFFDPSGTLPRGEREGIIQQIDIMPTLLGIIGYDKPYVAFGKDALATPPEDSWAFNWDFFPQLLKGRYVMRLKDFEVSEVYDYVGDPLLRHNLKGHLPEGVEEDMYTDMKAIIQSFNTRMKSNRVTVNPQ